LDAITFTFRNDTKNKFRYQEESEDEDVIGSLYISKSAFADGKAPPVLTVSIETEATVKKAKAGK
jgi:hypothetical protein